MKELNFSGSYIFHPTSLWFQKYLVLLIFWNAFFSHISPPSFLTACSFLKYAFSEVPQPWQQSSVMVGLLESAMSGTGHSSQSLPCNPCCQHLSTNTQYTKNQRKAKNMNSIMIVSEILVSLLDFFKSEYYTH